MDRKKQNLKEKMAREELNSVSGGMDDYEVLSLLSPYDKARITADVNIYKLDQNLTLEQTLEKIAAKYNSSPDYQRAAKLWATNTYLSL